MPEGICGGLSDRNFAGLNDSSSLANIHDTFVQLFCVHATGLITRVYRRLRPAQEYTTRRDKRREDKDDSLHPIRIEEGRKT